VPALSASRNRWGRRYGTATRSDPGSAGAV
jgi:hypothetical protein